MVLAGPEANYVEYSMVLVGRVQRIVNILWEKHVAGRVPGLGPGKRPGRRWAMPIASSCCVCVCVCVCVWFSLSY